MEVYIRLGEKDVDTCTGIRFCPSFHGRDCPGNGQQQGMECCCDECDYYLICFPEMDVSQK